MSVLTEVLKLFKYDPATDGDMTFNIGQCMNDNWDKLDAALLLAIAAAGAYNPEESYAVGDYCTYKGKLRKCSTAIPTGETWTEAHWTTTTVAAELAELSSQLSNLNTLVGGATTPQAALANLGAGVRPSKIINGAFQINQRGQDSYTGTWSYCFDGWVLASNTTATRNSNGDIIISNTSDSLKGYILQRIENPIFDTESTFSLLTTDGLFWTTGNMDSISHNAFSEETPFGNITVEYDSDNRQYVAVTLNEGQSITLPASKGDVAKFEDGNTQTLAYQDEDGTWQLLPQPESDYATQLAKCQRYALLGPLAGYPIVGGHVRIPIPVSMRTLPGFIGTAVISRESDNVVIANKALSPTENMGNVITCKIPDVSDRCYVNILSGSGFSADL